MAKIGTENCFETTTEAICHIKPNLPECQVLPEISVNKAELLG